MKRVFCPVLILLFVLLFVGCKKDDPTIPVAPTAIAINAEKTEIIVGEEMILTITVTPENALKSVVWTSGNNNVIEVVDSNAGKIKGINPGTAEIHVTSKKDTTVQDSIEITVKEIEYDDPAAVEVTAARSFLSVNGVLPLTATVTPATASQKVTYTSDDEAIATVSSDGLVTGKSTGEVTITVSVDANPELTAEIALSVVDGSLEVETVLIEGEAEMIEGTSINLSVTVFPAGTSQNVTWHSSHPEIAVVEDGVVTALKQGMVTITAISVQDPTVSGFHHITVNPDVPDVEYPNLEGYEIIVFGNEGHLDEHDPFRDDYNAPDKNSKQRAWTEVEQDFNCELNVVAYPTEAPWGPQRVTWMVQKAATNTAEADIFVSTTLWNKELVDGQALLDTTEWYNKYAKNQMSAAQKAASTYKSGLYSLLYSAVDGINIDQGIFYNLKLLNDLDLESPAKLFNNDEWTYTDFKNYVIEAQSRMTGDQTVLAGKPALYWIGMINAGGVRLADHLTLTLNFNHPYAVEAADILSETYLAGTWGDQGWDQNSVSFIESKTLFSVGEYWFLKSPDRWKEDIWGQDTKFGYVPFPYPDNLNKEDTRTVGYGGQCYSLAAGRSYPPAVNAESVYWAWTEMILRTGEYLAQDPTFDLNATMRVAASSRLDDPESAEAVIFFKQNKVLFDPFLSLQSFAGISPGIDNIVNSGEDYLQELAQYEATYLSSLYDMYG